jgi:hypothetical protein
MFKAVKMGESQKVELKCGPNTKEVAALYFLDLIFAMDLPSRF